LGLHCGGENIQYNSSSFGNTGGGGGLEKEERALEGGIGIRNQERDGGKSSDSEKKKAGLGSFGKANNRGKLDKGRGNKGKGGI